MIPEGGLKRVLIVKTGTTLPEIAARRGDFEDWIAAGMGLADGRVQVAAVYEGEPLPAPASPAGVVVTGSAAMVSERRPWSERTAGWLAEVVAAGTPVLGICYGHQLLAHALGGEVGRNPRGREIGTVEAELDADAAGDPLLGALGPRLVMHASHSESVLELPPGARRLARNAHDPHHAFAFGDRAWGVQLHPEFDADVMRGYLAGRRDDLLREGLDLDALTAGVRETPQGGALLRRFAELLRG